MTTYYCPTCWRQLPENAESCPHCGAEIGAFDKLQYVQKLMKAAFHPFPENRHMAVHVLGMLKTPRALPVLAQILREEKDDVYLLFEVLEALVAIRDPVSTELLQEATRHPYRLVRDRAKRYLHETDKRNGHVLMTHVILVRHGQTAWNRKDRFRGHADVPLDDTGLAQAEAAARRIVAQWKPSAIYAGPLSRTMKTGEATARVLGLKVEADPGLLDVDCGQWQGLTPDEARERWPAEFERYLHSPAGFAFPRGESLEHARTRAWVHARELAARHLDATIMLVSHTALNRLILLSVLGLDSHAFWSIRQDTCSINAFDIQQDRFTLVTLNETGHLLSFSAGSNPAEPSRTV